MKRQLKKQSKSLKNNNVSFNKVNVGVSFWNKKDKSTIEPKLNPYKLIEKQSGRQLAIIFCENIKQKFNFVKK